MQIMVGADSYLAGHFPFPVVPVAVYLSYAPCVRNELSCSRNRMQEQNEGLQNRTISVSM